ncbi:MAG: ATP-binding cassette domain-containing protein [Pseudomonadota bacterium]|nr:ATP-binding cassette domain-containing protein [Pseudomonadota bacterium]
MELIRINNLCKSFDKKNVHKGVSFSVIKGECLGLLGGSGTGKSLILRSMIGLEKIDSGEIRIAGTDITKFNERELLSVRQKVAYAFQGGALFDSMTVFDNLAYPLREHTKLTETDIYQKVLKTLSDFDLKGNEYLLPASLSGGMQKRVGLARAIILEPDIILYDEPTAGLDPYNTKVIQDTILRLKATGVTSILVTHDMPSALAVCDRIMMLMNGKIVATATPAEVREQPAGVIKNFMMGFHQKRQKGRD